MPEYDGWPVWALPRSKLPKYINLNAAEVYVKGTQNGFADKNGNDEFPVIHSNGPREITNQVCWDERKKRPNCNEDKSDCMFKFLLAELPVSLGQSNENVERERVHGSHVFIIFAASDLLNCDGQLVSRVSAGSPNAHLVITFFRRSSAK